VEKHRNTLREPSLQEYTSGLGFLVGAYEDRMVDEITGANLENVIAARDVAARTQNHMRARFHGLLALGPNFRSKAMSSGPNQA